jgi:ADP-ribose pyrophosphatase
MGTMSHIERTASRIVYQNRWMRVREDEIRRADGTSGIYGVVEKPDFVVIAAIEDDRLYLVEQYRYPVGERFWELPQGAWETVPNADPLDLARAELREETGLRAATMIHAGHLFQGYGYATQGYHVFYATDLVAGAPDLDAEEQDLISRGFALTDVDDMIREGIIQDATTVAALGLLRLRGFLPV